jgi:hypothetical protein
MSLGEHFQGVDARPLLLLWCCRRIGCRGRRISRRGFLGFALGLSLSLRFRFLLRSGRFSGRRLIALLSASVRRCQQARRRRYSRRHGRKPKKSSARNELRFDLFAHVLPLLIRTWPSFPPVNCSSTRVHWWIASRGLVAAIDEWRNAVLGVDSNRLSALS